MSYLFVVVIGAVAGWIAGQFVKGSEHGVGIDFAAGAVGAFVLVLLARMVGAASSGMIASSLIAVLGGIATLYAMRMFMRRKLVPAPRVRSRT